MDILNHAAPAAVDNLMSTQKLKPALQSLALFDDMYSFYNCSRVYYSYFGEIPNILALKQVDPKKVIQWMESRHAADILNHHYRKGTKGKGKEFTKTNAIYILKSRLLVDLEGDRSLRIYFTEESQEQANHLAKELDEFVQQPRRMNLSLVVDRGNGFELTHFNLKKPNLTLETHYNDDLLPVHLDIVQKLNRKRGSGLVLLHGVPGTGKTTYLRFLMQQLKKKVIYLPSKFVSNLDAADFTQFLCQHQNSVFVVEDAEALISCRDTGYNSNLSMLANVTDGILGETLGIHIIATYNTKTCHVDKALLRKGRLVARHEFKPLAAQKARALQEALGQKENLATGNMTLADIYHHAEPSYSPGHDANAGLGFRMQVLGK